MVMKKIKDNRSLKDMSEQYDELIKKWKPKPGIPDQHKFDILIPDKDDIIKQKNVRKKKRKTEIKKLLKQLNPTELKEIYDYILKIEESVDLKRAKIKQLEKEEKKVWKSISEKGK